MITNDKGKQICFISDATVEKGNFHPFISNISDTDKKILLQKTDLLTNTLSFNSTRKINTMD